MDLKRYNDSPVRTRISFHVIIERLKKVAEEGSGFRSERARQVLTRVAPHNVLYHGTTDPDILIEHEDLIAELLADIFPAMLSDNEIKGITVPFQNILLNPTNRLQRILREAGPGFKLAIRGYNHHQFYVNTCCLILNTHYGANFNFNRSLFYDIPNAQGIMKHYRILYNTDFMELSPTDKAVNITPRDIEILRDNFHNLELWKKYFPEGSWDYKGFAIVNLFDATLENAVSALKGTLLGSGYGTDLQSRMLQVFRSVYKIPDLGIGFASFDKAENKFSFATFSPGFKSYLLKDEKEEECIVLLKLVQQQKYVAISNIAQRLHEEPGNGMLRRLADQGIQSIILSPVVKNGHQLGIIELASSKTGELNSINANQLEIMMPYIADAFERQYNFMQSQIQALIQNEYTTIHPSVCWKFRKEALRALLARAAQNEYTLKSVMFSAVTPLYGQIDVKSSSDRRNSSVQLDLLVQLTAAVRILHYLPADKIDDFDLKISTLQKMADDVRLTVRSDTEQAAQNYLESQIHPVLIKHRAINPAAINNYFVQAERGGDYHLNRRMYDDTLTHINQKMASVLDQAQLAAQSVYPHYYERYKTDGVEHNMYIGQSISPAKKYDINMLYNLRLWQLQVMCQMELEYRVLKDNLPYQLDVASLILAYGHPMSIRFRLDEKRFDVDGSYNARFEVIKKRIDKARIKNSAERLTKAGKMTIVYTSSEEEAEYLRYVNFLQSRKLFEDDLEILEIEELQGVSGLKAIRAGINYENDPAHFKFSSYEDLICEEQVIVG